MNLSTGYGASHLWSKLLHQTSHSDILPIEQGPCLQHIQWGLSLVAIVEAGHVVRC